MGHRDYDQDYGMAKQFLEGYTHENEVGEIVPKYGPMLTNLAKREEVLMTIDLADLEGLNPELAEAVTGNTNRYMKIFQAAIDELLSTYENLKPRVNCLLDSGNDMRLSIVDHLKPRLGLGQRQHNSNETPQGRSGSGAKTSILDSLYPRELLRRYEIAFKPVSLVPIAIRAVNASSVGKLITVRGIVTSVTGIVPKATVVAYQCNTCLYETFQVVEGSEFIALIECKSPYCVSFESRGILRLNEFFSKLVKFQEITIQEHPDQMPSGLIPTALTVFASGEQTRKCEAGDHVSISGVYSIAERLNFVKGKTKLSYETYIQASYIIQMNKTACGELNTAPLSNDEALRLIRGRRNFLHILSKSIAPDIWGHKDLKIALLLLLVGGVDKAPNDMKVRGNINICMVGDPGVAKSQLLHFVESLASRCE